MNWPKLPNPTIAIFNGLGSSLGLLFDNSLFVVAAALADDETPGSCRPTRPREALVNEITGLVVLRVKQVGDLGVELALKGEALRVTEEAIFCVALPQLAQLVLAGRFKVERREHSYIYKSHNAHFVSCAHFPPLSIVE